VEAAKQAPDDKVKDRLVEVRTTYRRRPDHRPKEAHRLSGKVLVLALRAKSETPPRENANNIRARIGAQ
jgi:hypothetical protein